MFRAHALVPCQLGIHESIPAPRLHALSSFLPPPINPSALRTTASITKQSTTSTTASITQQSTRLNTIPHTQSSLNTMVSAKRLAQMAKKWQRMAAMGRKRLTRATSTAKGAGVEVSCTATSSSMAMKGHFVVYTTDGARFEVPLLHLGTAIVRELLRMSHDEFGFASDGGILLPCDAAVMEYVMCLLGRDASEEVQRALLSSVVRPCHYGNGLGQSMGISHQVAASSV